ncbi:MAG TPA: hypothetical protein VGD65_10370, partial [Chryseosolibacter sp.]
VYCSASHSQPYLKQFTSPGPERSIIVDHAATCTQARSRQISLTQSSTTPPAACANHPQRWKTKKQKMTKL